jgi:hypothetical protein
MAKEKVGLKDGLNNRKALVSILVNLYITSINMFLCTIMNTTWSDSLSE